MFVRRVRPVAYRSGVAISPAGQPSVLIRVLTAADAEDPALVQAVTDLANRVYADAEAGFWRSGFELAHVANKSRPEQIRSLFHFIH